MVRGKVYEIVGYDKDADVYVRLALIYSDLHVAISIANHIATLGLRRFGGDHYDWVEVITQHEGVSHHVIQCTRQSVKSDGDV